MKDLGIPEDVIGIDKIRTSNGRGFNPNGNTAGGVVRGDGIEVDSGVFNNIDGADVWNNASLSDRTDAVIAHEYLEFLGHSHDEVLKLAPLTDLKISDGARRILEEQLRLFGPK